MDIPPESPCNWHGRFWYKVVLAESCAQWSLVSEVLCSWDVWLVWAHIFWGIYSGTLGTTWKKPLGKPAGSHFHLFVLVGFAFA